MAELSYLQDRRQAYENLANRTNLDGVKSVSMALQLQPPKPAGEKQGERTMQAAVASFDRRC